MLVSTFQEKAQHNVRKNMHQALLQAGNVNRTAPALVPSPQYRIPPLSQEALSCPRVCNTWSMFCLHRLKLKVYINSVIQMLTPLPLKYCVCLRTVRSSHKAEKWQWTTQCGQNLPAPLSLTATEWFLTLFI